MRSQSHWDYRFSGSKLRYRLLMTSWMLLSCLYLIVVRMLRSRRDSLTLAVIFMSLLAVSQRSTDVCVGRTKVRGFRSLVLPVFLYGCETWTLTRDLRRRLNYVGTRSLRRILGYRWSYLVSNERLMRETQMRFVTCIVRERQLWLKPEWTCGSFS